MTFFSTHLTWTLSQRPWPNSKNTLELFFFKLSLWPSFKITPFTNGCFTDRSIQKSWNSYFFNRNRQISTLDRLNPLKIRLFNRYKRGLETCPKAKTSKSGHAIFFSFFPTRPSDEYDSAPSRKYSRPLWCKFACIG